MLENLLKKGYFPAELPVPFTTESYGDALLIQMNQNDRPFKYGNNGPKYISSCVKYNLARRGKLRRPLSVPNPVNYFHLAQLLANNWADFELVYGRSNQSLSKPVADNHSRALKWDKGFGTLPDEKLKTRTASRYILKADIANFYSTIYTHSIPWAIHTKAVAKQHRFFRNNLGNKIDLILRNGQDQQTKGVPIGSDTSYALAELIMSEIDMKLVTKIGNNYHRYIDDFEFGCKTLQEAEEILSVLQEVLSFYELELNSSKTQITKLPEQIDPKWLHELQKAQINMSTDTVQKNSLISFFDLTMSFLEKEPSEPILKYAVIRTSSHIVRANNYDLYQRILLQWAAAEPSTLPIVIDFIAFYKSAGVNVDLPEVKRTLQFIIIQNCRQGHTSEVCWSIFGMILLSQSFDDEVLLELKIVENPFIALLTLDARDRNLISSSYSFPLWESLMNKDELKTGNWILAYEALRKGWLPSQDGSNYLIEADGFSTLANNNVEFYSTDLIDQHDPKSNYKTLNRLTAEELRYFVHRDIPLERSLF
ncbi:RNA-directed DNA polymerase [Pseudoalteromonas sp. NGC95]|uniref:RNA-directed DNA polymerase n=1 Tax=Pseudoalteromonas sp. NGC95 TaxID=2792051 RepID=UPI0018CF84D1|nr:RNA-directed DNA polymerase [Pseudoalteromonas sp. NGC95]MBH0018706.1 RNA-directed DNA polymerase [Pseudoalteromonas sp. NGC95]